MRLRQNISRLARQLKGRMQAKPSHPRTGAPPSLNSAGSVLFFKKDGIGDFVLSTTFLDPCYESYPESRFTLLCNELFADLARHLYPRWNISPFPNLNQKGRLPLFGGEIRRLIQALPHHELLVDLRTYRHVTDSVLSSWLPADWKLSIENQITSPSLAYNGENRIYHKILTSHHRKHPNEVFQLCKNIEDFQEFSTQLLPGSPSRLPHLNFRITPESMPSFLPDPLDGIVLAPCAGSKLREYPLDSLIQIAHKSAQQHDLPLIILGGAGDRPRIDEALKKSESHRDSRTINACGLLSLAQSAWLMRHARGVLAVESGLAHIAIAMERPTVVLIGGGHYGLFAPWGYRRSTRWLTRHLPCFGCNWCCSLDQPHCIRDISPKEIESALDELMGRSQN